MNSPKEEENLKKEFEKAIYGIYEEAKIKYDYNGIRFLQMIREYDGLNAAQKIIRYSDVEFNEFYTKLFIKGNGSQDVFKLTVEALVLDPKWKTLFTDDERKIALVRMNKLNYKPT